LDFKPNSNALKGKARGDDQEAHTASKSDGTIKKILVGRTGLEPVTA
jgi:hypothetical protein